jgi:nitrate reductase gamma subunit
MVTREVFWGVPTNLQNLFYAAAVVAVLIFFVGIWIRTSIWTSGRDDENFSGFTNKDFFLFALKKFFSQDCILAKKSFSLATYRGVMLIFIIWGFSTLFLGTALLTVHHYSIQFLIGNTYLVFSFALEVAGLLLVIGLLIAIGRRHFDKEVKRVTNSEDLLFLYIFLFIVVSGFVVEGMRLAITRPPNMDYSFIGGLFSRIVNYLGVTGSVRYTTIWALHSSSVLFLIAYLPFSKFFHLFSAQVSVAAAETRYGGAIGGR